MNIGLYDIDSKIANLAIMKISAWHKKQDDNVQWYMPLMQFDKIYVSKIFNYSKMPEFAGNYEIGGTGFDIKKKLPAYIENCNPDYSIYPDCDYSIQLFSRGCIRNCKFCIVRKKEGYIYSVLPMKLNPKGKYIRILDNNFFANKDWRDAIQILIKYNQPVAFDSGLDVRLFNDEQGNALQQIKIYKYLHIAWDNPKQDLINKIKLLCKYVKPYLIMVYVLIGYDSTHDENYYRVMKIKELGCKPFVMPYNKKDNYQKRFARWVNMKAVFNAVAWKDYK